MKLTLKNRVLAILLAGLMLASAAACTKEPTPPSDTDQNTAADTPAITQAASKGETQPMTTPETASPTAPGTEPETQPAVPTLTVDELRDKLSASPYAETLKAEGFIGLSDPSAVGIVKDGLDTVKYPVPADADCAHVYLVTEHGITTDGTENAAKFNALMTELRSVEGVKKVVFPAGVYPFEATLRIEGVRDLYICSDKPDALFEISMTAWCQGISISNCQNLQLNDFAFDYATPTAVTGEVVSSSTTQAVIKIDEGYDLTDPRYNGGKITWGSYMEFKEDKATGKYVPNPKGNLLYNSTGDQVKNITDGSYDPETRELTLSFRSIGKVAKGTRVNVAYTMYEYFGMYATGCENIYLENANFYHTAGMCFGAGSTKNIYLNRFRLSPRDGRLMTATADGLHFGSCTGEVVLTNSVLEYSHDDCLNIKGAYVAVQSGSGNTIVAATSPNIGVEIGDTVDVYEINTFRFVGGFTVTALDGGTYTVAETLPEALDSGYMLCNASKSPTFKAQNCFFGNKRNRGMLIQCRGVEISNCTFQNIVHGAIQILSVADIFAEGIMPRDVVVKNNKFLGNAIEDVHIFTWGRGGTTSGTITDVTVTNNYFDFGGTNTYPVDILGGGDIEVSANLFDGMAGRSAVKIQTSERITVSGNLSCPKRKSGFRTVSQNETCKEITVTGNYIEDEAEN